MLALYLLFSIGTMLTIETFLDDYEEYLAPIAIVLTAILTVWTATRYLDHRPFRSLGLRLDGTWWRAFGVGTGFGTSARSARSSKRSRKRG